MRKNSPRKWLHAILDLLPVLIIPIFALAVRSDNNFEPISVEYGETHTQVNYKYQSNEVNNEDDLIIGNVYKFNFDTNNAPLTDYFAFDFYFLNGSITLIDSSGYDASLNDSTITSFMYGVETTTPYFDFWLTSENYIELYYDNLVFYNCNIVLLNLYECGNNVGNYFTYTDFNVIESVEEVGETVVLNQTDVGSQMLYTLYNATDKYFNMNQVFNFGEIYNWLTTNIFNGQVPLVVPIVWNIVLYEFVMDLIFLLYALFMFFIDFCTNLIDRFYTTCRGGH